MPGVHAVYTLEDLRPLLDARIARLWGNRLPSSSGFAAKSFRQNITPFILARDEVCYVGEPVAVVIAENRYIAEDAASRVGDRIRPLRPSRTAATRQSRRRARAPELRSNMLAEYTVGYGDCESVLRARRVMFLDFRSSSIAVARIPSRGEACSPLRRGGRQNDHLDFNPKPARGAIVARPAVRDGRRKAACDHAGCRAAASAPSI